MYEVTFTWPTIIFLSIIFGSLFIGELIIARALNVFVQWQISIRKRDKE